MTKFLARCSMLLLSTLASIGSFAATQDESFWLDLGIGYGMESELNTSVRLGFFLDGVFTDSVYVKYALSHSDYNSSSYGAGFVLDDFSLGLGMTNYSFETCDLDDNCVFETDLSDMYFEFGFLFWSNDSTQSSFEMVLQPEFDLVLGMSFGFSF